ncbi:TlpA family protein disulfide reductase [Saccharothrix australiensis]|uniref:Thiol-disulfide isomerase/thioredoxin n=1 Tax=Saccharothrix australiensis TaxID=2072 RepID=A0A495VUK9_9PSEU|nr:TlpA disulfide reductase family protein [Saccharothrix australiensis]RKT52115.1 thiol-disulfide isomerase/thioredoxin [Saccharothrix australiensis]
MSRGLRWAAVVVVLAVAGVVALWPRTPDTAPGTAPDGASSTRTAPARDLAALREQAALRPCPQGEGGPPPLRGVAVTCLGDGGSLDMGSALPGRALVNFWATWCLPCQDELRVLDAYSREPGAVPVVTVLVQSKEADGLELLAKLGVRLPSAFSEPDAVRKAVGTPPRLPLSYVVGADGSLAEVVDPIVLTSVEQVREVVG